jgi:hypothetical protein
VAKKKARTPMPPRTVQAPRRRDTKSSNPLAEVPRWVWFVSVGVIAGVVLIGVILASGGGNTDAKAAMLAAGCTYKDVKPLPPKKDPTNYHADVPSLTTPTKGLWSTSPPSAGAHYGLWAVWGFYRTPVNPRQVVHNEEHGAVVIWWGNKVPKSTVDQLESFYNQQPDGVFGTPYPALGDKIALTAWTGNPTDYYRNGNFGMGHIAVCSKFDQKAFDAFRSAYRGNGPEGIPLSADEPGSGPTS